MPESLRAKNVLEIFLYGGLSPWETFYVVPEYGQADNTQWWSFQGGEDSVENVYKACYGDAAPPMLMDWLTDSNMAQVRKGPFTEPLRSRTDIVERIRMHVNTHTLEPHEGAIPLALSGYRLGNPKLAGVGSAVQHYFQARDPSTTEPFSYVLFSPGDFPTDNLRSASAVGAHPGSARPLAINVQANQAFANALSRATVGADRAQFDALLNHYTSRFQQKLMAPGKDLGTRAPTFGDWQFANSTLQNTDALVDIITPELFSGVGGDACGESSSPNYPFMGLRMAAHLLTRPDSKAKYVNVIDGGLIPASGGGGYDTHNAHVRDSGRNLTNLWKALVGIINEPEENDPTKLNLSETLVVINTEFGRTPWSQNGDGRNHHPYAYVTLMFGGPAGLLQPGLLGAIGPDGYATQAMSPAETRAGILSALGIYPFAPECYAVSDVAGAGNETEAALWIKESVLGVTV